MAGLAPSARLAKVIHRLSLTDIIQHIIILYMRGNFVNHRKGKQHPRYKHGGTTGENRFEYNSWRAMMERCHNPKYWAYHRYGGRGIKVCHNWWSFPNFLKDMGKKPTPKHSLDRIDTDGDYTPENCRWSTQREQMAHMMRTRLVTIDGITMTMTEWERKFKIKDNVVRSRLRHGWNIQRALTTSVNPPGIKHS